MKSVGAKVIAFAEVSIGHSATMDTTGPCSQVPVTGFCKAVGQPAMAKWYMVAPSGPVATQR